jgi:hypothetical protein
VSLDGSGGAGVGAEFSLRIERWDGEGARVGDHQLRQSKLSNRICDVRLSREPHSSNTIMDLRSFDEIYFILTTATLTV